MFLQHFDRVKRRINMALIWLLTLITFLCQRSFGNNMKTTTGGAWASIRDECTLAKPELIYSHENITADFGTDIDLELGEGERLWVGYIEDMEIYRFYGCIARGYIEEKHVLEMNATVGLCYSACSNTNIFGLTKNNDNKVLCFCEKYNNNRNMNNARTLLTSCNSNDEDGFAIGKMGLLAVYERVSTNLSKALKDLDTWDDMNRSCLCNFDPSQQVFQWFWCKKYIRVLCNVSDINSFIGEHEENLPWKRAVDTCLENSLLPVPYRLTGLNYNSSNQFWLANVRSMTIEKDRGQTTSKFAKYGYIVKENNKLLLKFTAQEENLKGLCFKVTTSSFQTTNGSTENSNGILGVYVALPIVVLLAAIVVGTVILVKRRRRSSPEQVDNTKRNLTYEPDMQPNQNTHRPDSAEVYHEIEDVTESTNEGYDTIPDGYLHKSTQNNNTEVGLFVLEKHDNADYEFAREVTGETEHEYGGQPIKTTKTVTDDYDHIGQGNTGLKQSLGDQPYDKTSNVVNEKNWDPTYDHSGDHTTYDHTGDNSTFDRTADRTTYDHTGRHTIYDHTRDHTTYDHTGYYASNKGAVNSANNNHTEDNADYDHIAGHSS